MHHVRGHVARGRLVVDEPTDLPEGDVNLGVVVDDDDEWPEALDEELSARAADAAAGRHHSLEEILTLLRAGG